MSKKEAMKELNIQNIAEFEEITRQQAAVLAYFTGPGCGVCTVVKPKVESLLEMRFPKMAFCTINCEAQAEVAGQFGVHSVPTLILFFDGKETHRLARSFSIGELEQAIERTYHLLFDE